MKTRKALFALASLSLLFAAGCKKKTPAPPPPPVVKPDVKPDRQPAPVISSFTANPSTIVRGDATTLSWRVSNATEVSIDNGVGTVPETGSRQVYPTSNTTYRLMVKGPGGEAVGSVMVVVSTPPPAPTTAAPTTAAKRSLSERLAAEVGDIYFDYDSSQIREDARATLQRNVDALRSILAENPGSVILVEGHADERGSAEYNLGLGDRRSTSARDFLSQAGVPAGSLRTISYGKEKPQCMEANEGCWSKNRRVHFSAQ